VRRLRVLLLLAPLGCGRSERPRDLLLVTLDTTRADRLAAYGGAPDVSPRLDAFFREAVVLESAFCPIPETLPSHATLLTGLDPPAHGVRGNGIPLPAREATLAGTLRERGRATGAFVGSGALDPSFGLARGFETYDRAFLQEGEGDSSERRAGEVNAAALAWIRALPRDRSFFLWVHYYDPHAPYDPPAPYAERFRDRPYDGEVAYADACFGALIDALRVEGRLEDALVCVAADHGEGLGEHGEPFHSILLYEETVRVPLAFSSPRRLPPRRVRGVVRLADVAPTLLDLLGIPVPPGLDGRSLAPFLERGEVDERAAYLEASHGASAYGWAPLRGLRTAEWKYVRAPRPELYRLADDPRERRDLHASQAQVAARLERMLAEVEARAASRGASPSAPDPNAEALLASLGYAGGGRASVPGSDRDPKDFVDEVALFYRAAELGREKRFGEAMARIEPLAARDPNNPEAAILLGDLAWSAGDFATAERWLSRAIELKPGHARSRLLHAVVAAQRGEKGIAEERFREALRWNPSHAETRENLAALLLQGGRPAEAERLLRDLLRERPRRLGAWTRLVAILASDPARRAEAAEALETALAHRPDAMELAEMLEALRRAPPGR
jgi:arylsulfatase A-like enzyme/Flp pilus assembly protein TadD